MGVASEADVDKSQPEPSPVLQRDQAGKRKACDWAKRGAEQTCEWAQHLTPSTAPGMRNSLRRFELYACLPSRHTCFLNPLITEVWDRVS